MDNPRDYHRAECTGKRIAQARKEKGYTMWGLAERLGGHTSTSIECWERGLICCSDATLERIADILGKDFSWFVQDL